VSKPGCLGRAEVVQGAKPREQQSLEFAHEGLKHPPGYGFGR
jgi:hypothetical protein